MVTVVNNVMNPDNNTGLGITAVGNFDGCLFGITWDYSKGANQVDIHLTKVELDYPVN